MANYITSLIYPLTFIPHLKDYIWGGRNLEKLYQRPLPPGEIAESWEIAGHPNGVTVVEDGPWAGRSLPDLLAELGPDLVGYRAQWALALQKFPLLIKLIDAHHNLSVQVHPQDDYALAHAGGELGKTEMWYILHAEPGAKVIFGVKPGVTAENFRQAIEHNALEDKLHYLPVKAGDVIFVEAGALHAILAGVMVAEIQQNSDVTYRVYDWGRLGADGQPRPLHVDHAIAVSNFVQVEPGPYVPQFVEQTQGLKRSEISRCAYFVVELIELAAGMNYQGYTDGSSLEIWGTIEGQSRLTWAESSLDLPTIRFCLIPAALGDFTVTTATASKMLRVYLPERET